ncbi:DNA replication terminus site-binding protein [Aeromonas taiwanensis]|uniref:DNA replication terminus site-binding protein n=1 Tax=Aeromonas taiwanensis TaxID=633417 RepID=UPI0024686928|nr:DNA replication terminus site-binding protein [Aeromonas taiwanensis]
MAKNFISEQFSAMCRDLTNLSSLIKRLPPRYAKVAAIPPTGKGMENEPVNKIVVTEQTGREALELAAHSYRDLHINPDYSQKSARRTVGVLWFSPSRIGVPRLPLKLRGAKCLDLQGANLKTLNIRELIDEDCCCI